MLLHSDSCVVEGNHCCFIGCITHFNIDIHSNVYEPIFFKLNMMIVASKSYVFVPVYVAVILNKDHRIARKQNIYGSYLAQFSIDLDKSRYAV